jgi:hypothetical protein
MDAARLCVVAPPKFHNDAARCVFHVLEVSAASRLRLSVKKGTRSGAFVHSAAGFCPRARPLGSAARGRLGFFTPQLAGALEALLALVLAQDAGLLDTGLEAAQQLIEGLAFTSFNVHRCSVLF